MKISSLAFALCFLSSSALFAQDATPPVVSVPISDLAVAKDSAPTVINLKKTFALQGVTGKIYRFSTTIGNVDVAMLSDRAPKTVATFLSYATTAGSNGSSAYTYNNTLLQRAVPSFIVQGGGFYVDSGGQINQITGRPSIPSEAGVKNTRGTLAMALSTGPDSGTGDFFFNVADNTMLDVSDPNDPNYDGGPFTVFGSVVGNGLVTLDAIEALPQRDFSSSLGGAFTNVPLVNFDGSNASVANLVYLNSITVLPLTPKTQGSTAALVLKVKGNTNPDLVTASLDARKLTLSYAPGMTGTATIKVMAKSPTTKSKVFATFTVTVQ